MNLPLQSPTQLKHLLPDNLFCDFNRNIKKLKNGIYSLWGNPKYEPKARSESRIRICFHRLGFLYYWSHFRCWFKISFYYAMKWKKKSDWSQGRPFICRWTYEMDSSEITWETETNTCLLCVVWYHALLYATELERIIWAVYIFIANVVIIYIPRLKQKYNPPWKYISFVKIIRKRLKYWFS